VLLLLSFSLFFDFFFFFFLVGDVGAVAGRLDSPVGGRGGAVGGRRDSSELVSGCMGPAPFSFSIALLGALGDWVGIVV
jgi:hypothetical protein